MKQILFILIMVSCISYAQETKIVIKDDKEYVCEKMKRKIHKQPVKKYKCKLVK